MTAGPDGPSPTIGSGLFPGNVVRTHFFSAPRCHVACWRSFADTSSQAARGSGSQSRELVLRPSLLVLDEPVSALDVSVQAQIINLLRAKQLEHALTYLFISHDLSLIRSIATRVAVMYLGRICEIGDVGAVFDHPRHHYMRGLLDALPELRARIKRPPSVNGEVPNPLHPPTGCVFPLQGSDVTHTCRSQFPFGSTG